METWAHCSTCDRWFYASKSQKAVQTCPVCGEPSTRFEQRDSDGPATSVQR